MKNKLIEEIIEDDITMENYTALCATTMRPALNDKQVVEVVRRALEEFEEYEPADGNEIIMRVEFHADDVLGHGDEEYAYTGDEE